MLALLFPGQGSQFVGMGKDLSEWSASARHTLEEADDALGFFISRMCFSGPAEDLMLTENTQPAILAVSVAAFRALNDQAELTPAFVAGHSLGEYSALVAAGSISFADALMAVRERGRAMQDAVPPGRGAMAALMGLDRKEITAICEELTDEKGLVTPANFNSPGQIVIAGNSSRVEEALALFKERGGRRGVLLPVSAPFHCSLMTPAADRMQEVLSDINIDSPKTVLINNAEAASLTSAAEITPSLIRQITSPVLWEDTIRRLLREEVNAFLELGPGRVLSGLMRRIEKTAQAVSFGSPGEFDAAAAMAEENG